MNARNSGEGKTSSSDQTFPSASQHGVDSCEEDRARAREMGAASKRSVTDTRIVINSTSGASMVLPQLTGSYANG